MNAASDPSQLFDDDYLYFYAERTSPAQSDADVEILWRTLALASGLDVLDLACGAGRIANRLAARGCRVTGLDVSAVLLEHARRDAEARGVAVEYVLGTMIDLPWRERFDRALSWFTAFGYLDDAADRGVLRAVREALRPGGLFLIEHLHRDQVLRVFREEIVVEHGDDFLIDRNSFDPITGRIDTQRTIIRGGEVRRLRFSVRLFAFSELRDWLLDAGFLRVVGHDGRGGPLRGDCPRMIVVAER